MLRYVWFVPRINLDSPKYSGVDDGRKPGRETNNIETTTSAAAVGTLRGSGWGALFAWDYGRGSDHIALQ